MLLVRPPPSKTVMITITDVVVSMRRLAGVEVFRMANANAMAPRKPAKNIKCCIFKSILFLLERVKFMT